MIPFTSHCKNQGIGNSTSKSVFFQLSRKNRNSFTHRDNQAADPDLANNILYDCGTLLSLVEEFFHLCKRDD